MLDTLRPEQLANMNTATVVMGLTPTILAAIGPTATEIALLSFHRPLLTILLSVGSPELFLNRLAMFDNPLKIIDNNAGALVVPPLSTHWAVLTSVVQYILAGGAVVNVLYTSHDSGK
jgi:hypothetical protein